MPQGAAVDRLASPTESVRRERLLDKVTRSLTHARRRATWALRHTGAHQQHRSQAAFCHSRVKPLAQQSLAAMLALRLPFDLAFAPRRAMVSRGVVDDDAFFSAGVVADSAASGVIHAALISWGLLDSATKQVSLAMSADSLGEYAAHHDAVSKLKLGATQLDGIANVLQLADEAAQQPPASLAQTPRSARPFHLFLSALASTPADSEAAMKFLRRHGVLDRDYLLVDVSRLTQQIFNDLFHHAQVSRRTYFVWEHPPIEDEPTPLQTLSLKETWVQCLVDPSGSDLFYVPAYSARVLSNSAS